MVTSKQVATAAGVSRTTVSRVLNGSGRISAEVRQRVHATALALGYEPDVVAQSLARQRSRVIALSLFSNDEELPLARLAEPKHYFYLDVLRNIERETTIAGYDLLQPSRSHGNTAKTYLRSLQTRRIAGAILMALGPTDPRIQIMVQSNIPTVFVDNMGRGPHATYVKGDNVDGARQVTEHLLSLGHRRIAFMTGQATDLPSTERLLGAQQALARIGLTMDLGLVRPSGWNTNDAYEAATTLLNERRDFTAIVAGSDLMAIGILRALREHNLRVPEDISLTGFDDVDLCNYTDPPLTTVRQDRMAMGQGTVQLLLRMLEGVQEVSPLVLPTQLIVRKSTGEAPG